jgi:nitroreductase
MNKFASKAQAFFVVTEITAKLAIGASIKFDRNHFVKYDVGELVAYLTLTAKNEGLDTCILGWLNHDNLKEVVGFSDDEFCAMIIAVGYSETPLRKKIRKSFDGKVTII